MFSLSLSANEEITCTWDKRKMYCLYGIINGDVTLSKTELFVF